MNTERIVATVAGAIFTLVGCAAVLKARIRIEHTDLQITGIAARAIGAVFLGIGIWILLAR